MTLSRLFYVMKGKLILVGAGPGDPELITLKGVKAIESADVLLYDALANEVLLNYASNSCIKKFVGKKPSIHQTQQVDINKLIVEYAQKGKTVVRLKGGDPYLFGRGHEEQVYARENGIDTEVIPGVSSFYAVPEVNQLPLTRRGLSESFWVLTGTTKDLELAKDIRRAAESDATIVVLMGMNKLSEICDIFKETEKSQTLITIIQNGTLPSQKIVKGTIESIQNLVKRAKMSNPAIIVIGEVNQVLEKL